MAKDIHDKYVDPPFTTDFAIMFLPFESIYAEVIRRTSLVETLQKDYKIVVTGPTTLGAILNSLQMGFRVSYSKANRRGLDGIRSCKNRIQQIRRTTRKSTEKPSKCRRPTRRRSNG